MRRITHAAAIVLAVGLVFAVSPAMASHGTGDFVYTGHAVAPNPTTTAVQGVSELVGSAVCGETRLPGVDGEWVNLPSGSGGHTFSVVSTVATDDWDVWWYTGDCALIGGNATAGDEFGAVALGAEWAAVDLFLGGGFPLPEFTLTVEAVL